MWRLIAVASLVLTLALGSQATASPGCQICIESAQAEQSSSTLTLRFTARAADGASFPETGTAVVMRFDGQQSKCLNVTLRKVEQNGAFATYAGSFTAYSGTFASGASKYDGRVDVGGNIHEFAVTVDGKPGTVKFVSATAAPATQAPTVAPATSAPTTAPTTAPQPAEPAPVASRVAGVDLTALTANPMLLLGIAVIGITAISLFFERRRARIATA